MDANTKKFQSILLAVLGVGLLVGLLVFGGVIKAPVRSSSSSISATGTVVMWGPFQGSASLTEFIFAFNEENPTVTLSYVPKNPETYDSELLEAFASGTVPDIIILPHDLLQRYQDKVVVLSNETFPLQNFRDLYSQGAEVLRTSEGTVALPLGVDPMVLYYNRDILESNGFINPPAFWNEDVLQQVSKIVTTENDDITISVAGIALGETVNIPHGTEILSTLMMQLGSPMLGVTGSGLVQAVFSQPSSLTNNPGSAALTFFTQFSNPSDDHYSWNKALPVARDLFAANTLALYPGFASELLDIQRKNPNLNFDVAELPQIKEINRKVTYGNFYGLAIPKISQNTNGAFPVAGSLTSGAYNQEFLQVLSLQPVRRDLLAASPVLVYEKVFLNSAIVARAWQIPNKGLVDNIFSTMVSAVTSGRLNSDRAISEAVQKINELL